MPNGLNYPITDVAAVIITPLVNRDEIIIRCAGPGTVTFGVNESPVAGTGISLESGDAWVITGKKASAAIYAVCPSGEISTLNVQLD